MKTVELIRALKPSERKQFEIYIKSYKRQSLAELYRLLDKHLRSKYAEQWPEKSRLYQQLYQEGYEPEKDYLLRNELRLLAEALEEFMLGIYVEQRYLKQPKTRDLDILRSFLARGQYALFERQWQHIYKEALQREDYAFLLDLEDEYSTYLYRSGAYTWEHYSKYRDFMQRHLLHLERYQRERYAEAERQLLSLDAVLQRIEPNYRAELPPSPYLPLSEDAPAVLRFLDLAKQSYRFIEVAEQIACTEEALACFARITDSRPEYQILAIGLQNNLALAYRQQGRGEEAAVLFDAILSRVSILEDDTQVLSILLNAGITAMLLGRPERVQTYAEQYEEAIARDSRFAHPFVRLLILAKLQLDQTEQAAALWAAWPEPSENSESMDQPYRLLLGAFLAQAQGDYSQGLSLLDELLNLNQHYSSQMEQLKLYARIYREFMRQLPDIEAHKARVFYNYLREGQKPGLSLLELCGKQLLRCLEKYCPPVDNY